MVNDHGKESHKQYSNCISLGWFCGTACSMEKLGLRSCTGPFDWCFSEYWAVLKQIENRFSDFMQYDNLRVIEGKEKEFIDIKYQFHYNHDIKENFEAEYSEICEKYKRRSERFMKDILLPTLFFRTIRNQKEIEFINANWSYAEELLKQYNSQNRIVYVKCSSLEGLTDQVVAYDLTIPSYIGKKYEMRHMFDSSASLLSFCTNLINTEKLHNNLKFDKLKNF